VWADVSCRAKTGKFQLSQEDSTVGEHYKQHWKYLIVTAVFQYHNKGSVMNFQLGTEVLTELRNLSFQPNTSII
jgi:hypothetical protein